MSFSHIWWLCLKITYNKLYHTTIASGISLLLHDAEGGRAYYNLLVS